MNEKQIQQSLNALLVALPYINDVLDNPEHLACFKPGVAQAHAVQVRQAIDALMASAQSHYKVEASE